MEGGGVKVSSGDTFKHFRDTDCSPPSQFHARCKKVEQDASVFDRPLFAERLTTEKLLKTR